MQLQAGLVKIVCGVSLLTGLSLPAQAVSPTNDSLLCAAYMDVAVTDLYPLGAIPYKKAEGMLLSRFTSMAAVSITTQEPISDVVTSFIEARGRVRQDLVRSSGLNAMRLYTPDQILKYAKLLDAKVTKHCTPADDVLKKLMVNPGKDVVVGKFVEASKELKSRDKVSSNQDVYEADLKEEVDEADEVDIPDEVVVVTDPQ